MIRAWWKVDARADVGELPIKLVYLEGEVI